MLPSYWALKAMVWPSGEKTGFDLDADVRGEPAGVLAVEVGDPEVVGVDEGDVARPTIAGMVSSRVSAVSGCGQAGRAGARSPTAVRSANKSVRFMMTVRVGGNGFRRAATSYAPPEIREGRSIFDADAINRMR